MSKNLFKKGVAVVMTAACALSIVTCANMQTPVNPVLTANPAVEDTDKGIEESKNSSFELFEDNAVGTVAKAQFKDAKNNPASAGSVQKDYDKKAADDAAAPVKGDEHSNLEVLEVIDISATEKDDVTLTLYAAPSESRATVDFRELETRARSGDADKYVTAVISGKGDMEDNVYRHFLDVNKYLAVTKELMADEYSLSVDDINYVIPEGVDATDVVEVDTYIQFFAADGTQLYVNDNLRAALDPAAMLKYSPDEISFEGDITSISAAAFAFCEELTEIEIPATVKTIGYNAFSFCSNLTSVVLNNGLEEIGERAFMQCRNLGKIVLPATVKAIGEDAFVNMMDGARIVCPNESVYKLAEAKGAAVEMAAENLDGFEVLETYDISATKNDNVTLTLYSAPVMNTKTAFASGTKLDFDNIQSQDEEGRDYVIAKITGTGDMMDYVYTNFVDVNLYIETTCQILADYYEIKVSDVDYRFVGETDMNDVFQVDANIRYYTLVDCKAGRAGTRLTINNELRDKLNPATMLKYSPDEIVIEEGVTSVSDAAFLFCNDLTEVVLPATVKSIGENAFSFCQNLTQITLNEGLERIGERAFMFCTALGEIKLPTTITAIESGAFLNIKEGSAILCPTFEIYMLANTDAVVDFDMTDVAQYDIATGEIGPNAPDEDVVIVQVYDRVHEGGMD